MYSLFCERVNKIQMKLTELLSYTDFAISLTAFSLNDFQSFVCNLSTSSGLFSYDVQIKSKSFKDYAVNLKYNFIFYFVHFYTTWALFSYNWPLFLVIITLHLL